MSTTALRTLVLDALGEVLKKDLSATPDSTRLFADLGLDSTSIIELLMVLEDATGLDVDPDDLVPEVFETIGSLTAFVVAHAPAPVA